MKRKIVNILEQKVDNNSNIANFVFVKNSGFFLHTVVSVRNLLLPLVVYRLHHRIQFVPLKLMLTYFCQGIALKIRKIHRKEYFCNTCHVPCIVKSLWKHIVVKGNKSLSHFRSLVKCTCTT